MRRLYRRIRDLLIGCDVCGMPSWREARHRPHAVRRHLSYCPRRPR